MKGFFGLEPGSAAFVIGRIVLGTAMPDQKTWARYSVIMIQFLRNT